MAGEQQTYYVDGAKTNLVVKDEGNAGGIKKVFEQSDPGKATDAINRLASLHSYASGEMANEIAGIKKDLAAAWEGKDANHALTVIDDMSKNAQHLASTSKRLHDGLSSFQQTWNSLRDQAAGTDGGNAFVHTVSFTLAGDADDSGARDIYKNFLNACNDTTRDYFPDQLYYFAPLDGSNSSYQQGDYKKPTNGGGPDAPSIPGPGPTGSSPISTNGIPDSNLPTDNGPNGNQNDDWPPRDDNGGNDYPENNGPGSPGPNLPGYDGSNYGSGSDYSLPGSSGGVGYNDGSSLAGVGGGAGGGLGGGGGLPPGADGLGGGGGVPGGGGPGAGAGGLAGGGAGAGAGGLVGGGAGAGAGAAGGANGGRGMMMPMSGGGQGNGDDERERSTWLEEDDDVWGAGDAPPGVIS